MYNNSILTIMSKTVMQSACSRNNYMIFYNKYIYQLFVV